MTTDQLRAEANRLHRAAVQIEAERPDDHAAIRSARIEAAEAADQWRWSRDGRPGAQLLAEAARTAREG